eukprot:CAMPEP_0177169528 /NCGR_PEP_ID=MMETSP0367-20130122/9623_1 /TAXON_ID=447022 ORGANISM="Scrippsiella hangoei-like, Strain SHHI-4" /NCGR_SAMPLE_ID=MMETSP0367 /ASSEMBLY_ACC=CAM_ASM_000362 /LENGTH=631 /DNA_ID=CAMNT_0018615685 /DNA_START=30 /DNA_END=1925 /DNA_ORIENTATION=+
MAHQEDVTEGGKTAADFLRSGVPEACQHELLITGTLKHGTLKLTLSPNATIGEVKFKIFNLLNIPTPIQRLMGDGFSDPEDRSTMVALGYPKTIKLELLAYNKEVSARLKIIAQEGDEEAIKRALAAPADPNFIDPSDGDATPLHVAAELGIATASGRLCIACADMDAAMDGGLAPLHIAAFNGHEELVKMLMFEFNAHKDRVARDGSTALHVCAMGNQPKIAAMAVPVEGEDRYPQQGELYAVAPSHEARAYRARSHRRGVARGPERGAATSEEKTSLFLAAEIGHVKVVEELLSDEIVASWRKAVQHTGWAPLHAASVSGHLECVKALCMLNAEPNQRTHLKETPLHLGIAAGHMGVTELLMKADGDVNMVMLGGSTPFHIAIQRNQVPMVQFLIKNFAQVMLSKEDGSSTFFLAAEKGHLEMCKLMLEAEADVDLASLYLRTPLMAAADAGYTHVVRLLCEKSARVDKPMDNGATPLFVASDRGHGAIVELLLGAGAFKDFKMLNDQRSPLHVAAHNGHSVVVRALCKAGANVDLKMHGGCAPLHAASQQGHEGVVSILCQFKADIESLTDDFSGDGWTPLLMAASERHDKVGRLLCKRGADIEVPMKIAKAVGDEDMVSFLNRVRQD